LKVIVSVAVSGNEPSSSVTSKLTVAEEPMSLTVGENSTLAVM